MRLQRSIVLLALLVIAAAAAAPAFGSAIIARNFTRPTLTIDRHGRAHLGWYSGTQRRRLLVWGAINALAPSTTQPQVRFRLRYGGRAKGGVCLPYDGPPLAWLVKACKAPDGTYWALQAWQRLVPNYGGTEGASELHLSHWSGPLAQLVVYQNWAFGGVRHLFGRLTYGGFGVYGFTATGQGAPRDSYGRNIYVDTFDSAYGQGWHRENSFLTHRGGGAPGDFCYGFFRHGSRPSGDGTRYRATVEGPGVTPDVMWTGDDIGPFDAAVNAREQRLEQSWGDPKCQT